VTAHVAPGRPTTTVLVAGGLLLAALLAGCEDDPGGTGSSAAPTPPAGTTGAPGQTPSGPPTAPPLPTQRNGPITDAQRYLGADASDYDWRSFDPVSETGLFVALTSSDDLEGVVVVGRTGPVATLTCARDLPCSPENNGRPYAATLGPGSDEVTVEYGDSAVRVIGYDGTARRTIDLGAATTPGAHVGSLRWSPDGSRLAAATFQDHPSDAGVSQVWLVDSGGGDAQLAYSLLFDETEPLTHAGSDFDGDGGIWSASDWGWSPDGQTLLLDVRDVGSYGAEVVLLHVQPDGAADPVIAQTLYHSNRNFDIAGNVAWSPDGTRIAVRTNSHIIEVSAEDGAVVGLHPGVPGWLIWPAREVGTVDQRTLGRGRGLGQAVPWFLTVPGTPAARHVGVRDHPPHVRLRMLHAADPCPAHVGLLQARLEQVFRTGRRRREQVGQPVERRPARRHELCEVLVDVHRVPLRSHMPPERHGGPRRFVALSEIFEPGV
jgi:hypothetical protein